MTLRGKLIALFPALHLTLIIWRIFVFAQHPTVVNFGLIAFVLYIFPLAVYRIHLLFYPLDDGHWDLSAKTYNPWWGSHMIQFTFIAIPWIEAPIHFVPGAFSIWLRLWGSRIGKSVYWTPRVEVIDRGLIEVGDYVIIGHLTIFCSHMVAEMEGRPCLVIKKIKIGKGSFIGADTQFGPGALVAPRTKVKPKARLYWRGEWP